MSAVDDIPTSQQPRKKERRLPCCTASYQTTFFSLATTDEGFRERRFHPTKIIGILSLAEANPSIALIREHTVEKLIQLYPQRFASRVVLDRVGRAVFHEIPSTEIDRNYHFQVVDGSNFSPNNNHKGIINHLVSQAHCLRWDRFRPLWKIILVINEKDRRSILCSIVDHTLGDGTSMAAIMTSLLDDSPANGMKVHPPKKEKKRPSNIRYSHKVVLHLYSLYFGTIGLSLVPSDPDNCLKLSTEHKRSKPKGRKCSQTKKYPLEEVKALKNRFQGSVTVNDLITAVASLAIKKYYEEAHDAVLREGRPVHLTFAIDHRSPETTLEDLQAEGGSNCIVAGRFRVPLGNPSTTSSSIVSPIDVLWRCKSQMDIYKHTPLTSIAWITSIIAFGLLPRRLLEMIALDVFFKPTGSISNVVGPAQESSLAGYIIDDFSFYGTAPGQGFYLGVVTYNQRLRMCICMDNYLVHADPDDFVVCLEGAYDELKHAIETATPAELSQPDMTPISARILQWSFVPAILMMISWAVSS